MSETLNAAGMTWRDLYPDVDHSGSWYPTPVQQRALACPLREVLYGGSAGGGKLLRLDEPIPTPNGWTTMGDLHDGDLVLTELGYVTTVLRAHPPETPKRAYRLTFDDGFSIEAGEEHLWLTFDAKELHQLTTRTPEWRAARRAKRKSRVTGNKSKRFSDAITERNRDNAPPTLPAPAGTVRSTAEIASTLRLPSGRANHAIPVTEPLMGIDQDLPLDPYLLGCWLGDGTSREGQITTADDEIVAAFRFRFMPGAISRKPDNCAAGYRFLGLREVLRGMNLLCNKHIPPAYLRASADERLALLQGLMDTDGHASLEGKTEFTTTSARLAVDVTELIVSLGWKVAAREGRATLYGRDIGPKWRLVWTPDRAVFRLERKASRQRMSTRRTTRFRYIVACEPCEPVPMRCITVDNPTSLYLAGRAMVPTHNSIWLLQDVIPHALKFPQFNSILFRQTADDLTYLIETSRDMYKAADPGAVWHETTKTWKWSSGAHSRFAHLKDYSDVHKYIGQEYQWMGFDEVQLLKDKRCYFFLINSRLRAKQNFMPCYARCTANPGGAQWVYEYFIEPAPAGTVICNPRTMHKRIFIRAKLSDNPHMPEDYRRTLEGLDEVTRKQLLEGDWHVHLGMAFRGWRSHLHVVRERFEIPRGWYRFRAGDYGYTAPSCILWAAADPDNRLYIYDELYGSRMDGDQLAAAILKREKERGDRVTRGVLDPSCRNRVEGRRSVMQAMWQAGVRWQPADNDRRQGFYEMQRRINHIDKTEDGKETASLRVFEHCRHLLHTIPSMVRATNGDEDVEEGGDDHAYDSCRYLVMHRPLKVRVPGEDPDEQAPRDLVAERWAHADEFTGY